MYVVVAETIHNTTKFVEWWRCNATVEISAIKTLFGLLSIALRSGVVVYDRNVTSLLYFPDV